MTATSGPPPTDPAPAPGGLDAFWQTMRRLGVRRSTTDRWVGGVCAGVADRLGIDPVVVRAAAVVLSLLGGLGVALYAVAWLLLPDEAGRLEAEQLVRGDVSTSAVVALLLVAVAAVVPAPWAWVDRGPVVDGGDIVALLVLGTLVLLATTWLPRELSRNRGGAPAATQQPAPPAWVAQPCRPARKGPGPVLTPAVTGVALLAAGGTWLAVDAGTLPANPQVLAACAALSVLALALVGLGLAGRRDGAVGGLGVLTGLLTIAIAVVPSWSTTRLAGDVTWRPADAAAAERGWTLGAGDAVLDLTGLDGSRSSGVVTVPVRVGLGQLRVNVPEDMDVTVRSRVVVGSAGTEDGAPVHWATNGRTTGVGVDRTLRSDGSGPEVVVDARALVGQITIVPVADR